MLTTGDAGLELVEVREGEASILVPRENLTEPYPLKHGNRVFYNPIMEFNRDLSILAVECHAKGSFRQLRVLDAMTGCGVRGIRYALEVEHVGHVLLNDMQPVACGLARRNAERNKVENKEVTCMDANLVFALHSTTDTRFDVVDLDPFGSPASFLDSAVRAVSNNGLLALTATDMPPLCGVRPKAALRKYGGRPLQTEYCHEIAVRLLIASLVSTAARHDLGIDVKLAHSTDHYVRAYCSIRHGCGRASQTLDRLGYIAHCFRCSYREVSNKLHSSKTTCRICNDHYAYAGPLWLGNLYDKEFCKEMLRLVDLKKLQKKNRVIRVIRRIIDEDDSLPTYYRIDRLSDRYQTPTPKPQTVVEEAHNMGYAASLTHFHGYGVRTNADPDVLEHILRKLSQKTCA